jgi:hypothetical protein
VRGGENIEKFIRIFVCLVVAAMGFGSAIPAISAADYSDYYITGGKIVTNDTGIKYQITKKDNTTSVKWNRSIVTAGAVGIQRYTVLVQDNRGTDFRLSAINKYTGNNRWSMKLDQAYTRLQFIGGKYAVLMNENKFIQINLYTHKIVTGKTFAAAADTFSLIKSKKNGQYYVMTITDDVTQFFKLISS